MTTTAPMAITMGDASGVGPEIVLRRARRAAALGADVVVYGDAAILRHGAALLGLDVDVDASTIRGDALDRGALNVVDLGLLARRRPPPGPARRRGRAPRRATTSLRATDDALAGAVAGIVTMPMNKEATQLADPGFVGHTELIAERAARSEVTMMLTRLGDARAVTHVSTHCSLREAIERVTAARGCST